MASNDVKLFTLAEVAKHNTNKKSWICIHNVIYDVTEFLNEVSFNFIYLLKKKFCNHVQGFICLRLNISIIS